MCVEAGKVVFGPDGGREEEEEGWRVRKWRGGTPDHVESRKREERGGGRRSLLPAVTGEASTTRCRVAPAQTNPREEGRLGSRWHGGFCRLILLYNDDFK